MMIQQRQRYGQPRQPQQAQGLNMGNRASTPLGVPGAKIVGYQGASPIVTGPGQMMDRRGPWMGQNASSPFMEQQPGMVGQQPMFGGSVGGQHWNGSQWAPNEMGVSYRQGFTVRPQSPMNPNAFRKTGLHQSLGLT